MKNKTLVFTGGHHTSALVVAKQLKEQGWNIIWFGHRQSMWGDRSDSGEYKEVTAAGIPFYDLQAGKFHRTYNPLKLIRIPWGFVQALWWLVNIRPQGIVSFGGYLAVPTVIMGWLMGIPAITHEQTAVAGFANTAIVRFVKRIALTWPSSMPMYPTAKSQVIGLPVRPEILTLIDKKATKHAKPLIYVTGGKQGSHALNALIFSALPQLLEKYSVIHQTGSSTVYADYDQARKHQASNYAAFDYDNQKAIDAWAGADIVISRAGAHTIYELGVLGKRAVLMPIPWVSHREQDVNAQILAAAGNAVVLPQSQATPESLLTAIDQASSLSAKPLDLPLDATQAMVAMVEKELG